MPRRDYCAGSPSAVKDFTAEGGDARLRVVLDAAMSLLRNIASDDASGAKLAGVQQWLTTPEAFN